MIRVTFRWYRGVASVRVRGLSPLTGEKKDSTSRIPRVEFIKAGVDPDSKSKYSVRRIKEVGIAYAHRVEQKENSNRAANGEVTLARLWELYAAGESSQLNAATIDRSRKYAKAAIAFFAKHYPDTTPSMIGLSALTKFRDTRLEDKRSPATVFREIGFVRQLLRWGLEHSDVTGIRNLSVASLPRVKDRKGTKPKHALTPEQLFALLDATYQLPRRGHVLRQIITFAVCTGLRKRPLLGMRGEFIDHKRRWLEIPSETMLNKGRFDRDTYNPISLPLCNWALSPIADLPRAGLLWPSQHTKNTEIQWLAPSIRKACMLAKLPFVVTLHDFRRTFNTLLLTHRCREHKGPTEEITREKLMGHTPSALRLAYSFLTDDVLREAVSRFDCIAKPYLRKARTPKAV